MDGDVIERRLLVGAEEDLGAALEKLARERDYAEDEVDAAVVNEDNGTFVRRPLQRNKI